MALALHCAVFRRWRKHWERSGYPQRPTDHPAPGTQSGRLGMLHSVHLCTWGACMVWAQHAGPARRWGCSREQCSSRQSGCTVGQGGCCAGQAWCALHRPSHHTAGMAAETPPGGQPEPGARRGHEHKRSDGPELGAGEAQTCGRRSSSLCMPTIALPTSAQWEMVMALLQTDCGRDKRDQRAQRPA